jgi:septal ring factor EnvC (AmiA/AmiB activator)
MRSSHRDPKLAMLAAGLVACLSLPARVDAQTASRGAEPATRAEIESERAAREKALEASKDRARVLEGEIRTLGKEAADLQQTSIELAARVQESEGKLTQLEGRIGELEVQERMLKGSLAKRHDHIAGLMASMQRMGRNPPPVMVTKRKDALQMVRSAMLLSRAFPELREQAVALSRELGELKRIGDGMRKEGEALRQETARSNERRQELGRLVEAKRKALAERSSELEEIQRTVRRIVREGGQFEEVLAKLDRAVMQHVEDREKQQAAAAKASPQAPAPPASGPPPAASGSAASGSASTGSGGSATNPPAPADPQSSTDVAAFELRPRGKGRDMTGSRMRPAMSLARLRGQLRPPVQGQRLIGFGERTPHSGEAKGLYLETRFGAQVTNPTDGWVVFAGPFRTLGQLLIINADDGYHVVLAGMSQIDVQTGQFVLAGEPIGTMSAVPRGSSRALKASSPVLYVEFRKEGAPIDPEPWWMVNTRKVQG